MHSYLKPKSYPAVFAAMFLALGTLASCGSEPGDVAPDDISGSSSAEAIGKAYTNEMAQIAATLEGIESDADADRAIEAIQKARANLEKMTDSLEGDLSAVKLAQIMSSDGGEIMQVQQRISGAMMKLAQSNPQLLQRISNEMNKLPGNK